MIGRAWRLASSGIILDWGPAVFVVVFAALANVADRYPGRPLTSASLVAVFAVAVLLRRRYPLAAHGTVVVAAVVAAVRMPPTEQGSFEPFFALMLTMNAVAASTGSRLVVASALVGCTGFNFALLFDNGLSAATEFAPVVVWSATAAAIGRAFRNRTQLLLLLEDKAARLERDRETETRRVLAEERGRIARELHDIVAHNVSVMVIQAGGARLAMQNDPARARDALQTVERTGRQALSEMRRLVGLLRTDGDGPAFAPTPGIASVERLVGEVEAAGLVVDVRREGEARALPPGVDLAAYRVIQESLTNVLKHAGKRRAVLTLRFAPERLDIEVVDDGTGGSIRPGGNGLIGMRERVGLYGGSFEAGPTPGRGFRVSVSLPIEDPAS